MTQWLKHFPFCLLPVAVLYYGFLLRSEAVVGQDLGARLDAMERRIAAQDETIRKLEAGQTERDNSLRRLPPTNSPDSSNQRHSQDDSSVDERLHRLERSVPGLAGDERNFLEGLSTISNRTLNGRIHLDYWTFPKDSAGINTIESGDPSLDPQDRLLNRRIRFGLRGSVPPNNVSYRAEIEFSGRTGGRVRDAWLGWDDLAWFNTMRLGNQKRPYGLDHLNSSNFNVFLERPFIVDALNEDNRRFGLVTYRASDNLALNWRYGAFNAVPLQLNNAIIGDNYQMELAGRLATTWWYDKASSGRGYGHCAISGSAVFPDGRAPNDGVQDNQARFRTFPEARAGNRWLDTGRITGANAYQLVGVETVFNAGALQIAAEFMHVTLQRDASTGGSVNFHGGYIYVSYFLTGEHLPWDRHLGILGRLEPLENFFHVNTCDRSIASGLGAWQIAARLSYGDLNDDDILGGIGESATIGLNWYWNSHTRLQFNYIVGRIDNRRTDLTGGGTAIVSGDYHIAGTRFMIDF